MPRHLHIVRHGAVVIDRTARASDWSLSPGVDADVIRLLDRFDPSSLRRVVTSSEKKARQTGRILAAALGLPMEVRHGLEEHHRGRGDVMEVAVFRSRLAAFFAQPKDQVFGDESAEASLTRFEAAVRKLMDETADDELIVSHGRVISLFLASRQKSDPMRIWSTLKLPDHRVIAW